VNGRQVKPGTQVRGDEGIEILAGEDRYVSRGGHKLDQALDSFGISVNGAVVLDVGASTGGFTDCLLKRGASRVIALDVGKGQLHCRLREDPRVTVMERLNARYLKREDLEVEPSLATIDVSFISLKKIVEPVLGVLSGKGEAVALVKPQFEAGPSLVGKGGVVREAAVHRDVIRSLNTWMQERGIGVIGLVTSPLKGPKGNLEFFLHISGGLPSRVGNEEIDQEVMLAHVDI